MTHALRHRAIASSSHHELGHCHHPHIKATSNHRIFSSSSTSAMDETQRELHEYMKEHGLATVATRDGIVRALQSAYGRQPKLSDLQSLGDQGLNDLAAAVVQEEEDRQKSGGRGGTARPRVKIRVSIPHHRTSHENLSWRLNESILDVTKHYPDLLGEYVEGTCGGQMSCCTCHVYLSASLMKVLDELQLGVTESELDMLDLAYDYRPDHSRLGCQVVLTNAVLQAVLDSTKKNYGDDTMHDNHDEGEVEDSLLTVTLPSGVNNVWK
jgi:ferredoxin